MRERAKVGCAQGTRRCRECFKTRISENREERTGRERKTVEGDEDRYQCRSKVGFCFFFLLI